MNSSGQISIGLPVYNGERFIRKRLDSILAQTFSNFELIISDNASTDSTSLICEEYSKKDKRIRYIRQEKNKGITGNFVFVLEQAKCEYFVWAAVDDFWHPDFLKKNIETLLSNQKLVGSISKVSYYEEKNENTKSDKIDLTFRILLKKIRESLKPRGIYSLYGSYEEKVRLCLKKSRMQMLYGVYSTDKLRKSMITENFAGNDLPIILNVLKYGDFHVVDEVLLNIFDAGMSKKGYLSFMRQFKTGTMDIIFPSYPLTRWCAKHLGTRLFIKNLDYFIQLNLWAEFSLFMDIIRLFTRKVGKV